MPIGIRFGAYALTSWRCMLPATVAFTFAAGALAPGAADTLSVELSR
jgi:hypothetical protein